MSRCTFPMRESFLLRYFPLFLHPSYHLNSPYDYDIQQQHTWKAESDHHDTSTDMTCFIPNSFHAHCFAECWLTGYLLLSNRDACSEDDRLFFKTENMTPVKKKNGGGASLLTGTDGVC